MPGKVHEWNNSCGCTDAVCRCPKHLKGMYRYTIDGEEWDEPDYERSRRQHVELFDTLLLVEIAY